MDPGGRLPGTRCRLSFKRLDLERLRTWLRGRKPPGGIEITGSVEGTLAIDRSGAQAGPLEGAAADPVARGRSGRDLAPQGNVPGAAQSGPHRGHHGTRRSQGRKRPPDRPRHRSVSIGNHQPAAEESRSTCASAAGSTWPPSRISTATFIRRAALKSASPSAARWRSRRSPAAWRSRTPPSAWPSFRWWFRIPTA